MWLRVKIVFLRALVSVLPILAKIDGFVIDRYQRFIGDPLQFRGFSLGMQVRTYYVIAAVGSLFVGWSNIVVGGAVWLRLMSFLPFILWMARAFYDDLSHLEPKHGGVVNGCRFYPYIFFRFLTLYMMLIMLLIGVWYWIFILLAQIATACDPKSPRPRHVKALKLAMES